MSTQQHDAVVVGAGFAGLYMLHRLRELGFSARVFEAGDGVGGTWYWNRYPGARCDVESMAYSYSFSPELEQEWEWTERYPSQPEILRYINHVADRFDLRRDIQLQTRVTTAHYDEDADRWTIATDAGDRVSARWCIFATGCLSVSKMPEVEGLETFQGDWYHTGHWPHDGVDFSGQRVGVIGTGSSGIQAIPIIAEQASAMTVFQRTPNFSLPAFNGPLDPADASAMKARYREHREAARTSGFGIPVELPTKSALEVDEEERLKAYERAYEKGNLTGVILCYTDLITDEEANETAAEFIRSKIRETVEDPEVAEALLPRDYPFATKRPCLDTGYYETFNADHVDLVDLRTEPLRRITPAGVETEGGEYAFDSLVFATGFDAMTGALAAIDIRGRGGQLLSAKWADGPSAYLGLGVAGFPNMFTITGPGSPSVLSNMMVSIEQHVEWIADCLDWLRERGRSVIEPAEEAEQAWMAHVAEAGAATLYPKADSWYMGANVPGKPRVFMPYIGGVGPYRERCDEVAEADYEGFVTA